jgi:hypothetical protein
MCIRQYFPNTFVKDGIDCTMLQIAVMFTNQVSDRPGVYVVTEPTVDDLFVITQKERAVRLRDCEYQQLMMRGERFDYTFDLSDLEYIAVTLEEAVIV